MATMRGGDAATRAGLYTNMPTLVGLLPKFVTCWSEPCAASTTTATAATTMNFTRVKRPICDTRGSCNRCLGDVEFHSSCPLLSRSTHGFDARSFRQAVDGSNHEWRPAKLRVVDANDGHRCCKSTSKHPDGELSHEGNRRASWSFDSIGRQRVWSELEHVSSMSTSTARGI
ncbi:hypothetical protein BD779DRAFT_1053566 [Infundibulicybe gibba]|nr:hypothetical protein BD779DRAFT_1053566 [Infundibulicybe gibba]